MKIKKKFLILNEAIGSPDKLVVDDKIKITLDDGRNLVLVITNIKGDELTLTDGKGRVYKLNKNQLINDDTTIEYSVYRSGKKSMKTKTLKNKISSVTSDNDEANVVDAESEDDDEVSKAEKETEEEELTKEQQRVIDDFFEAAGGLRKGETIVLINGDTELELSLETKLHSNAVSMDYVGHSGNLGEHEDKIVNSMDIILYPSETKFNKALSFNATLEFESSPSTTIVLGPIKDYRIETGAKLQKEDKFIDSLLSINAGSNFMLTGEPDSKKFKPTSELYFKLLDKDLKSGKVKVKYFRGVNVKPEDGKTLDTMSNKPSIITKDSFESVSDNKGKLTFLLKGDSVTIIVDSTVTKINKTEEEITSKSFYKLSPEKQKEIFFNNVDVRQSYLRRPTLLGKIFGRKAVGLIPAMQKADKERFGDGAKKFKSNRKIAFRFVGTIEDPFYDSRFIGKYESGGEFGGGVITHQHKDKNKNKINYRSTLHIKDVEDNEESTYNVLVITEKINENRGTTTQYKRYMSVIKIDNFNIS